MRRRHETHRPSELLVERALALTEGVTADDVCMTDLDDEIAATRHAYIAASITVIATARAELSGPRSGEVKNQWAAASELRPLWLRDRGSRTS